MSIEKIDALLTKLSELNTPSEDVHWAAGAPVSWDHIKFWVEELGERFTRRAEQNQIVAKAEAGDPNQLFDGIYVGLVDLSKIVAELSKAHEDLQPISRSLYSLASNFSKTSKRSV
jgi:hypothetical protein